MDLKVSLLLNHIFILKGESPCYFLFWTFLLEPWGYWSSSTIMAFTWKHRISKRLPALSARATDRLEWFDLENWRPRKDASTMTRFRHGRGIFLKTTWLVCLTTEGMDDFFSWSVFGNSACVFFGHFCWDVHDSVGDTLEVFFLRSRCWMKDLAVLICNLLNAWIADGQLVDRRFWGKERAPHSSQSNISRKDRLNQHVEVSESWKALATCVIG